ncbi:MAG: hypothetical protein ACYTHM_18030 [Planctomycetota bacterium]|jgi:hypothetical protein
MESQEEERRIRGEVELDAGLEAVWKAWLQVVLPRLRYRFKHGPVDWRNPPSLEAMQSVE